MAKKGMKIGKYTFQFAEFCSKKSAFAIKRAYDTNDDEKSANEMIEHLVVSIVDADGNTIAKDKYIDTVDDMDIVDFQKVLERCTEIFSGSQTIEEKKTLSNPSADS